jgi:lysozyme family protein
MNARSWILTAGLLGLGAALSAAEPAKPDEAEKKVYERALAFVLKWEGGFVDDPDDPGGRTNKGVTQATYDAHRKDKGLDKADVKDIKDDEVGDIYFNRYWRASHAHELPEKLAIAHLDAAVNLGVGRATKMLQEALGVEADGKFGPKTKEATAKADADAVLGKYLEARRKYYESIATGNKKKFLKGWLNRVNDLEKTLGSPG